MQRRIEGTYQSSQDVLKAVERLLNEGYKGEEIVVITDNNSNHQVELEDMSLIEVDAVDPNEGLSFWDKAKELLSFGNYSLDESNSPLLEYEIDETEAQTHNEALRNGEILVLVNKEQSQNNTPITKNNNPSQSQKVSDHQDDSLEETREEMKEEYEPSPGEEEVFDPSKAQSSREDKYSDEKFENQKDEELDGMKDKETKSQLDDNEAPQITGDEISVTLDQGSHEYQDNINTGYTEGSTDKSENDEYYKDEYQNEGGKTIENNDEKNRL